MGDGAVVPDRKCQKQGEGSEFGSKPSDEERKVGGKAPSNEAVLRKRGITNSLAAQPLGQEEGEEHEADGPFIEVELEVEVVGDEGSRKQAMIESITYHKRFNLVFIHSRLIRLPFFVALGLLPFELLKLVKGEKDSIGQGKQKWEIHDESHLGFKDIRGVFDAVGEIGEREETPQSLKYESDIC